MLRIKICQREGDQYLEGLFAIHTRSIDNLVAAINKFIKDQVVLMHDVDKVNWDKVQVTKDDISVINGETGSVIKEHDNFYIRIKKFQEIY